MEKSKREVLKLVGWATVMVVVPSAVIVGKRSASVGSVHADTEDENLIKALYCEKYPELIDTDFTTKDFVRFWRATPREIRPYFHGDMAWVMFRDRIVRVG